MPMPRPPSTLAGAHEQREADAVGHDARLLVRGGHAGSRVDDAQLVEDGGEAVAVLGQVDGFRRCP